MKPTNDERREIAAKMRKNADDNVIFIGTIVADEIGTCSFKDAKCWNRLADLIEPDNIPDNADGNAHGLSGSCDRDALLDLADEIERLSSDPKQCGREACAYFGHPDCNCDGCAAYSSDEPCIDLAAKDAASRIRDAIGGVKPDEWIALGEVGALRFPDGHACDMAEWEDAPNGPGSTLDVGTIYAVDEDSYEAVRWVRNNGGLDEVKRRVWASNELEAKLRSRERKIERLKKQLGYADAKNAERRAGAKWLKEHGGLCAVRRRVRNADNRLIELCDALDVFVDDAWNDVMAELRKRLMPEGMEWPRDAKGVPIVRGETVWANGGGKGDGRAWHVRRVCPGSAYPVDAEDGKGERRDLKAHWVTHERPEPKVRDADGAEIRVGDRLYDTGTGCGRTVRAVNDNGTVEFEGYENRGWFVRFLTHQRPVLDADGVPIREGDTVYVLDFDEPLTVKGFTDDGSVLMSFHDENSLGYKPSKLTHERPDSWERIEADCMQDAKDYCEEHGIEPEYPKHIGKAKCEDLVRRAKKLAERGA